MRSWSTFLSITPKEAPPIVSVCTTSNTTRENPTQILILLDVYTVLYPENVVELLSHSTIKRLLGVRPHTHTDAGVQLTWCGPVCERHIYLIHWFPRVLTKRKISQAHPGPDQSSLKDWPYKPAADPFASCHYPLSSLGPTEQSWQRFRKQQDMASLVPKYHMHSSTSDLKWRSLLPSPTVFLTVGCCSPNVR